MTSAVDLIIAKRDGKALSEQQLTELLDGYLAGEVPDYQMSAFLMATLFRGMTHEETTSLTRLMLRSGRTLNWDRDERPVVDKHSSGGVGDKISLILAPLLACLGMRIPMISGRGLGPTGGTLDKLESIPGFRCDLSLTEITRQVQELGCVITGTTPEIAPADARLYALRDVTGTVPSIPLITASILSKKLAEAPQCLVLDIKVGSGAFMTTLPAAQNLASSLVSVANAMGVKTRALLTDMHQPLGVRCGNALEVEETLEVLQGGGPQDVRTLVLRQAAEALLLTGMAESLPSAIAQATEVLDHGQALRRFRRMVQAQGGRIDEFEQPTQRLFQSPVPAPRSGVFAELVTSEVGSAINDLGGGRRKVGDSLNHHVGVLVHARCGQAVQQGDTLMTVVSDSESNGLAAASRIATAITISESAIAPQPLIFGVVDEHGQWHPEHSPEEGVPLDSES